MNIIKSRVTEKALQFRTAALEQGLIAKPAMNRWQFTKQRAFILDLSQGQIILLDPTVDRVVALASICCRVARFRLLGEHNELLDSLATSRSRLDDHHVTWALTNSLVLHRNPYYITLRTWLAEHGQDVDQIYRRAKAYTGKTRPVR